MDVTLVFTALMASRILSSAIFLDAGSSAVDPPELGLFLPLKMGEDDSVTAAASSGAVVSVWAAVLLVELLVQRFLEPVSGVDICFLDVSERSSLRVQLISSTVDLFLLFLTDPDTFVQQTVTGLDFLAGVAIKVFDSFIRSNVSRVVCVRLF